MGISRYPREGQRIAPKSLADLLQSTLPNAKDSHIHLSDLDETVWERFKSQKCYELSNAVVNEIRPRLHSLPRALRQRQLPRIPKWVTADDIDLGARTHNCLETAGLLATPQALANRSIGEIIKLPSFGVRSLIDLLCALESFVIWTPVQGLPNLQITAHAKRLARLPKLNRIKIVDPRFGTLLRSIGMPGDNAAEIIQKLILRDVDPTESSLVLLLLKKLRKRITIAAQMTLGDELTDLISSASTERDRDIAIKHLGWDGNLPRTLESVGQEYRMTRERVRQVSEKAREPLRSIHPYAPALDRTLKWLRTQLPSAVAQLELKLRSSRFVAKEFKIESIQSAAQELGRDTTFRIESAAGTRVLVAQDSEGDLDALVELARKSISKWGAATIEDLSEQMKALGHSTVSSAEVAKILALLSDFRWLDQNKGWFWLASVPRNSLLTQIKKIFAVTKRLTLADLRVGVSRHHRRKGFAPPRRVLAELCSQLGWCQVSGEWVSAHQQPSPSAVLSGTELVMVEVLNAHGNIMKREKFEQYCRAMGMKQITFYMYLGYSPIIERFARGVYGLRGRPVVPGEVEALKPLSRRPGHVLIDYGWIKGDHILLIYKLSAGLISSGVASIPAALRQTLQGQYVLNAADGSRVGTLVVGKSAAWGLLPFFRRRGGDVGDYLSIAFDVKSSAATVALGDIALCDELSETAVPAA